MDKEITFSLSYHQLTARTAEVIKVIKERRGQTADTKLACVEAVILLWSELATEGASDIRQVQDDIRLLQEFANGMKA
ncbi:MULTISPECIES: hypothetical protein [Enterobacter]|uniref:hypothetical protein n=1 Tax=Enterobacter TaxID=547 RepID=UPI002004BBF0|nr:hypothetical protein [Enterobacter cloacae]MCK7167266.1 hypothetical protein [Enterobacter cloacae]HDW1501931.1 hypothetical protein [Escherichia coli]